jgi:endoglucanase
MWLRTLLDRLNKSSSRSPGQIPRHRATRQQSASCRLAVEPLEDRCTPAAMLTIGDVTVLEGNEGSHNALVTVSLTEPHGNVVTVGYRTADGTAIAGSDYQAVSGKLTFAKNVMSKSILVPVIGDRIPEADKYFSVRLSNPKGGKIADGEGIVTIVDDEPRISINDVSALRDSGATSFTFTVSLSAGYDLPVTVHDATADGSAIAGIDYTAASGDLVFAPGQTSQTITVMVNGDQVAQPSKTFFVNLNTLDSYAAISKGVGVGTINWDGTGEGSGQVCPIGCVYVLGVCCNPTVNDCWGGVP